MPALNFPATHVSLLQRTRSLDPDTRARAIETLAAVYWGPVYSYLRLGRGLAREDAEDLVQGFFAEAMRRDVFARFDPARARFRTFLRACVDAHVTDEHRAEQRLKRGGGTSAVPLDVAELEGRLTSETDPDAVFHQEWVRALLSTAVARLRQQCERTGRLTHLALFERYDIAGASAAQTPTYAELAAQLGISTTQATNWLAAVRRDFRAIVLDTLRDISSDEEEFRAEARALLGLETP